MEDFNNDLVISVASLWEIAIKVYIGKLVLAEPFNQLIPEKLMVLFGFALFCAYLIRFDFNFEEIRRYKFFQALPLVVVIQFMSFYFIFHESVSGD